MMQSLKVGAIEVPPGQFVPPLLESLVAASRRGDDLLPYLQGIVRSFGFDSFEYRIASAPHADRFTPAACFSTIPEWTARYDRLGYVDIDPRASSTRKSALPLVWDQSTHRSLDPRNDAFLDDALRHGIGSGVSFTWHGHHHTRVCVSLNASMPVNDEIRAKAIARNLPEILMFAHCFHEIFMWPAVDFGRQRGVPIAPLSTRERECITLAANGLTTKDISHRLEITPRTVQFHFGNIYSKLHASNRQEAVARAVQTGIVGNI